MSLFTHIPHPHVSRRKATGPPKTADEFGPNERIAAWITEKVSTMWVVYFTVLFTLTWIALGSWGPLHAADPYPFAFLLFMGNVVQLLLVFVILLGQQVLGRAADKRAMQTYVDAEAILHEVDQLHQHLLKQDQVLNEGINLVEHSPHPWIELRKGAEPPRVEDQHIGRNGHIAATLTRAAGTMWAFYAAAIFQFGWMALSIGGILKFDPYPFAFMLFLSSLTQLVFMFVIMVGQDVLGKSGDGRAQQTYLDAEAILHECARLQHHLMAQDIVITKICHYISEHVPEEHPVRKPHKPQPEPKAAATV
jgi:uncharacterized membrane protein